MRFVNTASHKNHKRPKEVEALSNMSIIGWTKDWLLALPSGNIQTWEDLEEKFMEHFFPVIKLLEKQSEINNFEQGDAETLYDAS